MPNYNRVILAGNLTRDNEYRLTQGDTLSVLRNAIAVNRKSKDKEETMYIDIVLFGKQAEIFNSYTSKGRPVLIEGRLNLNTWEKEGVTRSKHEVIVDNFQFLGSRGDQPSAPYSGDAGRFNAPSDTPDDDMPF
ncbi:MAG: single-stranded DNA-binding protein [Deferribacteraceae bacterium]|jgi:single-strand DNA-binding protein|nr:single-stranded DNA-binding protein [Deferribacteraceae bacterium]